MSDTNTNSTEMTSKLSERIRHSYIELATQRGILSNASLNECEFVIKPVSGVGENSYGLIMQVCVSKKKNENKTETEEMQGRENENKQITTILKMSPKNDAFRAHARICDLYEREVFMYEQVFKEYRNLFEDNETVIENCDAYKFNIVPEIYHSCLQPYDEFLIFEDLSLSQHKQNERLCMPTFSIVCETFRTIAKFHAMSFILQAKKPQIFKKLIANLTDNLFTSDMEPVSVEFGKKYICKTRKMLEQSSNCTPSIKKGIEALKLLEDNFKAICLKCVNGSKCEPYAVICHGDFWNNNILYKYNVNNQATSAKLIDFQLSRYASPILDLVHYLYACTEKDLRDQHFMEFMEIYYENLTKQIEFYHLNINDIYPKHIFEAQLKDYGIYGFCMATFSIPFFISTSSELPNLDEVATAIRGISSSEASEEDDDGFDATNGTSEVSEANSKRLELLDEYDLLTDRTLPIFKRRMCGIVEDLVQHNMLDSLFNFNN